MFRIISSLTVTFIIGLTVGLGLNLSTTDSKDANTTTSTANVNIQESPPSDLSPLITQNECNQQIDIKLKEKILISRKENITSSKIENNETNSTNTDSSSVLNASEILVKFPPPHVAEPNFFGFDSHDEEVLRLRTEAINEFVYSMEEAGLPEEDIEAAIIQYRDEIDERASSIDANSNEETGEPLMIDEQAYDLAVSFWNDTDESTENIDQMTEDLIDSENELLINNRSFDQKTGLDHPEPQLK